MHGRWDNTARLSTWVLKTAKSLLKLWLSHCLSTCLTPFLKLFKPRFPYLWDRNKNSTYFIRLLCRLKETMNVKKLAQCLAHSNSLKNVLLPNCSRRTFCTQLLLIPLSIPAENWGNFSLVTFLFFDAICLSPKEAGKCARQYTCFQGDL